MANLDWGKAKIGLAPEKTLHPWTLLAGCTTQSRTLSHAMNSLFDWLLNGREIEDSESNLIQFTLPVDFIILDSVRSTGCSIWWRNTACTHKIKSSAAV